MAAAPPLDTALAGAERRAVPPFRSYVSVELPFAVTPTVTTSASPETADAALRRAIEAFVPASFLVPSLHSAAPQQLTATRGDGPPHDSDMDEEDEEEEESDDGDAPSRSGSSSSSSNGGGGEGAPLRPSSVQDATNGTAKAAQRDGGDRQPAPRLHTRHHRRYCAMPIFSGWRGTDWGDGDGEEDDHAADDNDNDNDNDGHAAAMQRMRRRRRREVFASTEPQLLVNGYYRNDLLVQVRQRRCIRRYRDPVTNAVLREEDVDGDDDDDGALLRAEVVGVVSREVELARPADFTFALFTAEQLAAEPSHCGADVFPPQHFISARAPFEVRYEPGRDANTAVADVAGGGGEASSAAQYDMGTLPTISVAAEESTELPRRQPAHEDFLRQLGSSLDGSLETDPREVQTMVRLLAARPSWVVQDLQDAMLQSGLCPRAHRNKQVMQCFTYLIRNGPFNRLRLRLGYDPYASPRSAVYERMAVRLLRRSDVGVRLRDVSRSPHIESVLRLLLERDKARRAEYKALPGHACRLTLLEVQCRTIRRGQLYVPFQLADVSDDAVMAGLVDAAVATTEAAAMEVGRRGERRGWLSEAAYSQATAHYAEALATLLEREVEPLLHKFHGDAAATATAAADDDDDAHAASDPAASAADASDEDDEEEEDSAMSSGGGGDLSSASSVLDN
ncbi:RNA polymerase III transcription factor (TF)IIIC subunit [Novymonas esmeraldas]|uniref:RNA polymerase III transcription factor (TF)IIIC subunit n=1 Tax=Novymonas esmeraldas TaxID=1808958 RepID=A0AAW0EMY7_9TRYP